MARKRKIVDPIALVRVIHDTSDCRQDTFIPKVEAERLFDEGKLEQVNCYAGRWDYYSNDRSAR